MKRLPRLTVYRAKDGWRWNYRAANGRVMADSAEAYVERNKCLRGACRVLNLHATWQDLEAFHSDSRDGCDTHVDRAPGWAGTLTVRIEDKR